MAAPAVDPDDIMDIRRLVEEAFATRPRNASGGLRPQGLDREESDLLVSIVLSELGSRGYVVAKPIEEEASLRSAPN